jgi:flavorubredoxin
VLKGLEKLDALDAQFACTSHGPVLTKGFWLDRIKQHYLQWAGAQRPAEKQIPIFYCSAYGNTDRLARHIEHGIKKALPSATVEVFDLVETDLSVAAELLNQSDAFVLGSPTINRDALPVIWNLLAGIDAVNICKRPVALFGSYGWSGEAVPHLAERLSSLKAKIFETQLKVQFMPTQADLDAAEQLGKDFAESL